MSGKCSKCGMPLEDDAIFCGNCGTSVASQENIGTQDFADQNADLVRKNIGAAGRCPVCGAPLEGDERFCESCGSVIPQGSGNLRAAGTDAGIYTGERRQTGNTGAYSESRQRQERQTYGNIQDSGGSAGGGNKDSDSIKIVLLIVGCVAVVLVIIAVFFVVRGTSSGSRKKETEIESQSSADISEAESVMETEDESETTEETVADTEGVDADIDAVSNRENIISGTFYYTANKDDAVVILDESISVYLNSTSGERVLLDSVQAVHFGSCELDADELELYNNVEVKVSGSLWAEDSTVYIDVDELYGEAKTKTETNEQTESEEDESDDYIIPDSDSKVLTDADVSGLSVKEINYAKNEIYARHGRKFDSTELRNYFNSKSWYNGTIDPEDFSDTVFNSYENKNIKFLTQKEKELGGYVLDQ